MELEKRIAISFVPSSQAVGFYERMGFRYSLIFGLFENAGFDITIPTKGNIKAVVLKTETRERVLIERAEDSWR